MGDAATADDAVRTNASPAAGFLENAGKVLRAYKLADVADLADRKADPNRQTRSVVVVGEVKRGKSSLVNALVGRRDICPVGVDVTSTVSVSVAAADDDPAGPHDSASLVFGDSETDVPLASLRDWVTVDGRRVTDPTSESLPTGAVVRVAGSALDAPGFDDVVLVDTPGVGGLDPSMSTLSQQSAQQACVLVLVCDAASPLTAPEMEFAKSAGASVDALIVAVTKTDKNLRRWKAIVEDNRRLLREHLHREVPVIGVSSLRAVIATELADDRLRAHLEEASGIAELRAEILTRLDTAQRLPELDAVRTMLEGLRTIDSRIERELAAVADGAARLPDLTAELERLTELKETARQWEQYLQRDITLIRQQAVDSIERRLDEVRDKWTLYINKNGMQVLRRSAQKFTADMQADLQMAMAETLAEFLERLHDDIVAPRFGDDQVVWEQLCEQIVESMQDKRIETHQVSSKRHGLLDPTLLSMGVMGSSMLGGMIGLSAIAGVGIVVGTVWVGVNLGFRAIRAGKTNLLAWLRETIGATKAATNRLLDSAVAQTRPEIVVRYREHLRTSIEELTHEVNTAKKSAEADSAIRAKSTERLTKNKEIVTKRITEGEALMKRFSAELNAVAA